MNFLLQRIQIYNFFFLGGGGGRGAMGRGGARISEFFYKES